MNALQVFGRYQKEVTQVSTWKNDVKVQYLYDNCLILLSNTRDIILIDTYFWLRVDFAN